MNKTHGAISEERFRAERDERVEELEREADALKQSMGDYRREHGKLEQFFSQLHEALTPYVIHPAATGYRMPKGQTRVSSPCGVVLCLNDWHYGAVQETSEVEGFGEFSPDICADRVMGLADKVIKWVEVQRGGYRLDDLTVLAVGDFISGDIHDELRVTNAFPTPKQSVGAGVLLSDVVAKMAPAFEHTTVHFVVPDNHGRLTKKPQAKEEGLNSHNYVVGFVAAERLAMHKNVQFSMYPQYETTVTVSGRRYLICHGHGVMGWMGFPYYGVERKIAREALRRMNGPDMRRFHRVIMGHWHAPMSHQWYWISGSVSGTDAFDHKNARHAPPSQAAWLVHPKYGEFNRIDFNLE